MIIIGAGYSGLLAGCINKDAVIYEANSEEDCAEKHQAVFRMRSNKIAEYLGINFKKVKVFKDIWYCFNSVQPTPRIMHMYSQKVSGIMSNRSISNIDAEIRYIPPDNFWQQLFEKSCNVVFNSHFNFKSEYDKLISTIPLKSMCEFLSPLYLKYGTMFSSSMKVKPIYVTRFKIKNCDSYSTIYYPHHDLKVYRATINGNTLIIESIEPLSYSDNDLTEVLSSMNIDEDSGIEKEITINAINNFGKITEIDNKIRSKLILDLTLKYNIYSLGRYATWRPKVMLDDVFDDIFVIRRLMEQGEYASVLYQQDLEKK